MDFQKLGQLFSTDVHSTKLFLLELSERQKIVLLEQKLHLSMQPIVLDTVSLYPLFVTIKFRNQA